MQSAWLKKYLEDTNNNELLGRVEDGEWSELAQRRYVDGLTDTPTTKDDENLITLLELLSSKKAQFTSLLGEMNLNDYYDDEATDPNEWYKSLGVKPPSPGSIWLVYDYHGISTAAAYAVPAIIQRSKLPPKRGPFGGIIEAPPLPPFKERSRYMVRGVLKGMLSAVATAHEAGIVHRSIGRNSFILSSAGQDKREATSPYAVVLSRLRVILSDWGFSATVSDAAEEKELGVRSKMFGIPSVDSYENQRSSDDRINVAAEEFAKAEDLNALGFVSTTFVSMRHIVCTFYLMMINLPLFRCFSPCSSQHWLNQPPYRRHCQQQMMTLGSDYSQKSSQRTWKPLEITVKMRMCGAMLLNCLTKRTELDGIY